MKIKTILPGMAALAMMAACGPAAGQPLETTAPANQAAPTEATAAPNAMPADTATALPASTATQPPASATAPAAMTPGHGLPANMLGLPQVEQATVDLATRLNVPPADVEVVSVTAVTWPNGALGCPQPGMAYAEVLVEGLLIELAHGGAVYNYHSGGSEPPFLCEQPGTIDKSTPLSPDV
jgi:hypothetical protein